MKTFEEIKYELYEKIENIVNNRGNLIINVTDKERTICYNSFFVEATTDRWHSYLYPKVTNVVYSDSITLIDWGKNIGITEESARDYWLRRLELYFKKIIGYDIKNLYYSFGNDAEYKGELYNKSKSNELLEIIKKESKRFLDNN